MAAAALLVATGAGSPVLAADRDAAEIPAASSFYCTVNNVAAFGPPTARVHLRCDENNGGIYYYAYASDAAHALTADQILAIANTALALGKGVWVYYNASSDSNPAGCNTTDCRGLTGISMIR